MLWSNFSILVLILFVQLIVGSKCPENGWIDCGNGKCVAEIFRCDGDDDCGNLKDEEDCEVSIKPPKPCPGFQCVADRHCIPQTWHCDGEQDCVDNSDELGCDGETLAYPCIGFRCKDHLCIPEAWRCDGRMDCPDESDEEGCPKDEPVCSPTEFLCSSGTCLDRQRVCDGKKDCSDASDEGEHCSDLCGNSTCSQKCRPTPSGQECFCNDGFELHRDNRTCLDIDECSNEGFCSQQCTNLIGSYSCSCMDGYHLINNTCRASGPEPLLVFSTLQEIKGMYLRTKRYFLVKKAVLKAAAVDVDPLESRVYWVEISNRSSVYSSKIDGDGFQEILVNGLMVPEDIAVDYVARNLYFTDSELKQILACKMDGSMCHVLHKTNVQKPRAIAVVPPEGFLYWSDWGNETAGIYRSGMDGSRRITLVSKDVKWPNGIAIDHTTNRLYWTDANLQTIEYITLDGLTRKVIMKDNVFHPYSLAVFEDNLYWSDWHTFSLDSCDKFTTRKMNIITKENGKHIMGVHVHHPVLARNASNPCWTSSCSHMCLIAPLGGYSCVCPPGFSLSNNGRTCSIDDHFPMILVSDESSIYRIRPEAVGNDIIDNLPLTAHFGKIGKLAYDWGTKTLFLTDLHQPAIYAVNMTSFVRRELIQNHLVTPEDLAYDSLNGNLYWVDSGKGSVGVVSLATSHMATIITNLSNPVAIALVPAIGRMFISTVGDNSSVSMYDMDGRNEKRLSSISGSAVSLAVHPSKNLLYWADPKAETISSIDYMDLLSKPTIVKGNIGHVMSLAVSDKFIYWTDSKHHVLSYLRHNTTFRSIIHLSDSKNGTFTRRVTYTTPFTSRRPIGKIGCESLNGGCSHLCLSSPSGRSCICPIGMVISKDGVTCTEKDCSPHEFQCVSKTKCIPKEFVCDGFSDCDDGSDEVCDETAKKCPGNDFRCSNGRCILRPWRCDGRDDCGDNSDEEGCPSTPRCAKDQFTCGSGECIPQLWRCDGETDCVDESDETDCHATACDPTEFRCDHGQCIPASWACDGAPDCFDNSDETNCTKLKTCSAKEFRCESDGKCVDKTLVCDSRKDCEDGSDEKNCSLSALNCRKDGHHLCEDGTTCIYTHEVCDGYKDCENGDDEVNCTRTAAQCKSDQYFCTHNSRCISRRWICDGDNDCGDEADENPENCTRRARPTTTTSKCEEFRCGHSSMCIPWSRVCDGVKDCGDLSDEGRQCTTACQEDNGGCDHKCQKTPEGPRCSCHSGYMLSDDERTCEDIDECETPGSCSHFCSNTKGGFKCSCADGYFLEHDHKSCKADGGAASFVYLLPDQIKGIDLNSRLTRVIMKDDDGADMRGMDYDAEEGLIFLSDWKEGAIHSYNVETNKQDVILTTSVRPHFIRWNWIVKTIYYTNDEGSIVSCRRDGQFCTTVIQNISTYVNSFDISPTTGLMFWSVWELVLHRGSAVIERAELDGSHRVKIVSDRIVWPTAVTVDHILNMLYWTDAKLNVIECADFHGLKRRTVVAGEPLYFPFSMTIFEDYVYWSNWGTDSLIRCDLFSGQNCTHIHRGNAKAEFVMVVHKVKQPKGVNHCDHNRCEQLCLPNSSGYTCKCDNLYVMKNTTCELKLSATPGPVTTTVPSCPENYCFHNAECVVLQDGELFYCLCPENFKGERCEIQISAKHDYFVYNT